MRLATDFQRPSAVARPAARSTAEIVRRWMDVPVMVLIGYFAIFAVSFGNLVDIEADNDKVSLSGQALIKIMLLGLGGLYGGIGVLTNQRVRDLLFSFPVMYMVLLAGLYCLSAPFSITPLMSMASTISIICVLLMTVTALVQFGVRPILQTIFYAMSLYVVLSWVAFLLVPSIGVFHEATVGGETVERMGGLAHPNTLGQVSGLTLVLGLLLFKLQPQISKWRMLILVLAAGSLLASLSRTSLLATIVAMAVVYRQHVFRRENFVRGLWLLFAGVILLMAAAMFSDVGSVIAGKLGMLSKSGDVGELTSATGRTDIWAYVLELLWRSPVVGYGAATSKYYLNEYSLHTHNLVLNIAFSTGVIGGLVAVWMCLDRIFRLFFHRHPLADALIVFILVNGLFENVIFSILAGVPTMIWITGLALPQLVDDEANQVLVSKGAQDEPDLLPTGIIRGGRFS